MDKKKILLLNPPAKRITFRDYYCSFTSKADYYWPPIDLLVLSGILKNNYQVVVIDAIIEKISNKDCLERVIGEKPDVIIFLTGTASWQADFEFIASVKKALTVLVIASGGFLLNKGSEFMRRFDFLDAVLLDFTSQDILKFVENQVCQTGDLICRRDGNIISGERDFSQKYFEIPIPQHELFRLDKYRLPTARRKPFTCVLTSYGCPFKCRFCIGGTVNYKKRTMANIIDELEYITSLGIKEIYFADFTFTAEKRHVMELCQQMIDRKMHLSWSCNVHSRTLDNEILSSMKRAGCHTVQIGVESGTEEILKKYGKATDKEVIRRAFALCKKLRIRTVGYFIIGLPGEDKNSVRNTIKFAEELNPNFASFAIATPDIGTPLWTEATEKGWFDPTIEEFDSTGYPVMETSTLTREEIWQLKNQANLEFYFRFSYIAKLLLSVRSPSNLFDIIQDGVGLIKNMFAKNQRLKDT
jgi:anaerobic magnesium-protoporphyrin IX monomethyl ester cyclase